jgi:hypothetical protein
MDLLVWLPCASKEMTEQLKYEDPIHRHCSIKSFTRLTFVLFVTDYYLTSASEPGSVRKPRFASFGQRTQSHFYQNLEMESF